MDTTQSTLLPPTVSVKVHCSYREPVWAYDETGTLAASTSVGSGEPAAAAAVPGTAGSPTRSFMGFQKSFLLHTAHEMVDF